MKLKKLIKQVKQFFYFKQVQTQNSFDKAISNWLEEIFNSHQKDNQWGK